MPISINKVYQKVLALANKEQRGYITPQEFNLFADQAQQEIFEQYFYDKNQAARGIKNNTEYSNVSEMLDQKISVFESIQFAVSATNGVVNYTALNTNMYRFGTVVANGTEVQKVSMSEALNINKSPLTKPTALRPIYTVSSTSSTIIPGQQTAAVGGFDVYPTTIQNVDITYVRKPKTPNWTYVISDGNALYNSNDSLHQDFELHDSESPSLVLKILQMAGVSIKDFNLTQVAAQSEASTVQQEKQ